VTRLRGTQLAAAVVAACAIVVASAVVGVAWGFLAPAQHDLMRSSGRVVPLTGESLHRFDATAMLGCAGLVVGVVSAVAAWAFRRSRGPLTFAGVLIGSAAGAAAMAGVGIWVAGLRYPQPSELKPGDVFAVAPGVGTFLVLVFQPLAVCVITLILAAFNPYDDLGVTDHEDDQPGSAVEDGDVQDPGSLEGDLAPGEIRWVAEAPQTRL